MFLPALPAEAAEPPRVEMTVVAPAEVRAGSVAPIAVVLTVPPGWHIYWENPGQSGLPTDVGLSLTYADAGPAVLAGPRSPTPTRFAADGLVNYGYDGDVAFVFEATVPGLGARKAAPLHVEATGSWLLCRDICVPGNGRSTAVVTFTPEAPKGAADPVDAHRAALPSPFATSGGTVALADGQLRITLPGPGPFDVFPSIPLEGAWAPTITTASDGSLVLTSPLPVAPAGAHLVLTRGAGPARAGFTLDLSPSPPTPG